MAEPDHTNATATTNDIAKDTTLSELFDRGLQNRREVVGDRFVDVALRNGSSSFARAGQELVTEWCWGYLWSRPGLSRRDRSLLNIALLCGNGRSTELATHVRGARRNGVSEEEIREAILHASVYCGVPAGVEGFKVAEKVLQDMQETGECDRELGHRAEGLNEDGLKVEEKK